VARYGGEEFIVLLPEVDVDHALLLTQEAMSKIAAMTINHQGLIVRTTISAGVNGCIPNHNSRPDSIITGADDALYLAKNSGRNKAVVFTSKS
jgi:two-component system chemotaxis family response regulator WspR